MSQNNAMKMNENRTATPAPPDSEVVVRAKRRQFSPGEKVRILQEADACTAPGQLGALLRREGIYSSYLTDWRREQASGASVKSGKRERGPDEQMAEMVRLRQENAQLKAQVAQAELIISAQKKLAQALEQTLTANKEMSSL